MIRTFSQTDFSKCIEIVNKVWDFDSRFKPQRLAAIFKTAYTNDGLSSSNFAVVVEEDGIVKGFLFGKCGDDHLFRNVFGRFMDNLGFLVQLFSVKGIRLGRKFYYLKILSEHERNRRKVEPSRENEVNLFAVDPHTQGKGYGKLLMNAFIDYCKKHNVVRITLDTDKECNFGFYDHFGFKVKGEFYSPLQKEYSGKSGDSYIYELEIKGTA
jgi:GNAT superfamily N-acetyltransferase